MIGLFRALIAITFSLSLSLSLSTPFLCLLASFFFAFHVEEVGKYTLSVLVLMKFIETGST